MRSGFNTLGRASSGLSVVNVIGTQLRELINSGLTRLLLLMILTFSVLVANPTVDGINGRPRGKREEPRE